MINTSPAELAWLLAGVVYPEHADEEPDRYVSDFHVAAGGKVSKRQTKAWTARLMAAKFIQKLLSKVGTRAKVISYNCDMYVYRSLAFV